MDPATGASRPHSDPILVPFVGVQPKRRSRVDADNRAAITTAPLNVLIRQLPLLYRLKIPRRSRRSRLERVPIAIVVGA